MNILPTLAIYLYIINYGGHVYMARGKKKSIDERIEAQQNIVECIQVRLEKENEALNALYREKKESEVNSLYDAIMEANLSVDEATEIIKQSINANACTE